MYRYENESVANALSVLYDSDHKYADRKRIILSSILFIDILSTNYYIISGCIVQLAHIEITMYFLLFYQFPLQQKLISFKIREYTNNTISGGSTIPTYFFDPPVLDISFFHLRTYYYET
jgi:hypothetical protein